MRRLLPRGREGGAAGAMWEVVGLPLPPALRQALVDGGFTAAEELGRAGPVALAEEAGISQEDALYACKVAGECLGRAGGG